MSSEKRTTLKIMVADDDLGTRMLLRAFLETHGHSVVEAADGEAAVEVFSREKPDLILMDVIMPIMTGYEAALLIKRECGNRFVPIIFLTGLKDDKSLAKCVQSGGDDFLVKPFNSVLMGAKIIAMQRIRALYQEQEQYQLHMQEEIELAQHVLDSLTKRTRKTVIPGLDYWVRAAGHFSGDLVIYDRSPSGKLYLMLCDFTGHGFAAAVGALPTSDIFFALTRRDFSVVDIVTEINRKLSSIMPIGHFCAAALVCCDPDARAVEYLNAGLPPILLVDQSGNIKAQGRSSSLALGVLLPEAFQVRVARFEDVDSHTLVLYSDGLTEARGDCGEMFGDVGLQAALARTDEPVASVRAALERHIGNRPPEDDISLIALRL